MVGIRALVDPLGALATDLQEDLGTRWVPDVIADSDLLGQLKRSSLRSDDVQLVDVPKVGGGYRRAPVMSGAAIGLLRRAVMPLRSISDEALDPAVCGYRVGASGNTTYSDEYRRFRAMSAAQADDHPFVVTADVSSFFDSVDLAQIKPAMSHRYGEAWRGVQDGLQQLHRLGVRGLPAGYGDARLIANLILAHVDDQISVPFTRWVDDYRLFVDSIDEADGVLRRLNLALNEVGLELNTAKSRVSPSADFLRHRVGPPLDSVYHPQDEAPEVVRSNLRGVFLRAVADQDRRLLRFAFPRLGEQKDDIAVGFVLAALETDQVDAPRMAQYLAAFLDDDRVSSQVQDLVIAHGRHSWNLLRLTPLLCRVSLRSDTMDMLVQTLLDTRSPAVWGAILRVLSVHGKGTFVDQAIRDRSTYPDPRAAAAAHLDLGWVIPAQLRERVSPTLDAIEELGFVPIPSVDSLL